MEKVRLSEPLFFAHLAGMNPLKPGKLALMRRTLAVIAYAITVLILLAELLFNYRGLDTLARASESLFAQYALGWKIAILLIYKNQLAQIIRGTEDFWELGEFGDIWVAQLSGQHLFLKRFFRLYAANLYFLCVQFLVIPLVSGSGQQSVMMYYKEHEIDSALYRNFVYVVHAIYMYFGGGIVVAFDCLFFYLLTHVITELRMIAAAFGSGNIGKTWEYQERFRNAIEHHIYVLDFVKKVSDTFSVMLLHQHVCCLFGICFGIFLMNKDGIPPDADHFSHYITYIFSYTLQIWTYCLAGDQVIHWSAKIPNEVFHECWDDEESFKVKTAQIIAIQRAQRPARIALGGFAFLDIESFNTVMKNAVNFFMFMDTMYKE